jgi:hypothetical protein
MPRRTGRAGTRLLRVELPANRNRRTRMSGRAALADQSDGEDGFPSGRRLATWWNRSHLPARRFVAARNTHERDSSLLVVPQRVMSAKAAHELPRADRHTAHDPPVRGRCDRPLLRRMRCHFPRSLFSPVGTSFVRASGRPDNLQDQCHGIARFLAVSDGLHTRLSLQEGLGAEKWSQIADYFPGGPRAIACAHRSRSNAFRTNATLAGRSPSRRMK